MFLSNNLRDCANSYTDAIESLAGRHPLSIAVAFWGAGAQDLVSNTLKADRTSRLLCNLGSGGTNPAVIEDLIAQGYTVRTLNTLHAKVLIGRDRAIIGSANLSSNGLGLEDTESAHWEEAGYLVNHPDGAAQAQAWFDSRWSQSQTITEEMLREAKAQWIKRRKSRPTIAAHFIEAEDSDLKNRNIYLVIFRAKASETAAQAMAQIQEDAAQSDSELLSNTKLEFLEDWPDKDQAGIEDDDDYEEIPKDTPLILVKYGLRGAVQVYGVARRIPQLDKPETETHKSMTILGYEPNLDGLAFPEEDREEFAQRLKPWLKELYAVSKAEGYDWDTGRSLPLDWFLEGKVRA